ncbi:hypothetical protein K439DRAFT_1619407 [Ramaria rubella]|nr:hypothetical protein K439DRAFT_1619407 [Ramaria rubella]
MASLWQRQPQWQPLPLVQHALTVHRRAPPPPPSLGQHPCFPNDGVIVESSDNTCVPLPQRQGRAAVDGDNTTAPEVSTSGVVVAPLPLLAQWYAPTMGLSLLYSMVTTPTTPGSDQLQIKPKAQAEAQAVRKPLLQSGCSLRVGLKLDRGNTSVDERTWWPNPGAARHQVPQA